MRLFLPLLLLSLNLLRSYDTHAQFVLSVNVVDASAPATCDGYAMIDPGFSNYTILWYMNGNQIQNGNIVITNLCPGNYSVTAMGNGIVLTAPFTIGVTTANPCSSFGMNTTGTLASSQNVCDGSITVNAYGGTPPYAYQLANTPMSSGSTFSNLCVGSYNVTVVDANGCTLSLVETVFYDTTTTNPCAGFSANITVTDCSAPGACDGAAVVSSTAAPNTFFVSWSQGSTTYGINNLCEGYYTAVVTDTNGCSVTLTEFVGYNGGGTIDTINVYGNIATGGMITGTLMSSWIYNCDIDMSILDTAYMVSATFGNNPVNQDSLYTVWYLADTTGAFTYINCVFYAPFPTGTYNLVLQVYCPIKSNPIYYQIISQFDVFTAGLSAKIPLNITLSPNPVQDELIINGQAVSSYMIYDQTGKCLLLGRYNDVIDVRPLANGTYYIKINDSVLPFIKSAQ